MKKRPSLWLIERILLVICAAFILFFGRTGVMETGVPAGTKLEDLDIRLIQSEEHVAITDTVIEDNRLKITMKALSVGKASVEVDIHEGYGYLNTAYVHFPKIIMINTYLGQLRGGWILPVSQSLFLAYVIYVLIRKYREKTAVNLFDYDNILTLGTIIFTVPIMIGQIWSAIRFSALDNYLEDIMSAASSFSFIILPLALVSSVLVTLSNIQLMKKEGRRLTNMLGCALGVALIIGTIGVYFIDEYLMWNQTSIDVHNQGGATLYIVMALRNIILTSISYLECILLATIILAIKAARSIPDFDRDYIMILGCQIRDDGSLTPLLKGRADRALEFARMQKQANGKDIIFVPSGGQGDDEIMAEGQAVGNYLLSQGIEPDHIIVEDRSVNTDVNFRYSRELIRQHHGEGEPKIAFSTTNYHVFRSGILAYRQNVPVQGIGSPTRSYFWINAFVREFIATLYYERKTHLTIRLIITIVMTVISHLQYLSNVL